MLINKLVVLDIFFVVNNFCYSVIFVGLNEVVELNVVDRKVVDEVFVKYIDEVGVC